MHPQTQANRLSELMQKKGELPRYELVLPLVTVRSLELKKLASEDVLLLGLRDLECLLLDKDMICANVILVKQQNRYKMQIVQRVDKRVKASESKKYTDIKLSFGMVWSRTLTLGHTIDMEQIDLNSVTCIVEDKKIATASLVCVNKEIAVKIGKVAKDG